MKTLQDLFEYQLRDLYSAEEQLLEMLQIFANKVKDDPLKVILENHLAETKQHLTRLEMICDELEISVLGNTSHAVDGLVTTVRQFFNENMEDDVLNAGLMALAQRLGHYEISGYSSAIRFAKELGLREISKKLQLTLNEAYETDDRISDMAEDRLSRKAMDNI
ncbi:DUF892 family protein [Flavobacteriaceae bacterium F89]|uniref:DUF892 family protein n=1 Tax=Cerina litoralis TaxID=2874477 RepID=A0AAE3EUF9_9FLAO|nr:DUF892 family protein [Cerina litoralis]MCG2459971.1 DUF892 family protein [Cerina litoralis]